MQKKYSILFVCFLALGFGVQAQDTIDWSNPSFEGIPKPNNVPEEWHDAAYFEDQSPPDTQPCLAFEVSKQAYLGNTYLGMVVRENETWEAVTQELEIPLMKGKQHSFSAYLAKSDTYRSAVRSDNGVVAQKIDFITPTVLRIWAGNKEGDKQQLLATSPAITNEEWKKYSFEFVPDKDYQYITLEAYYDLPIKFAYNGHILIDNLSPIFFKEIQK